MSEAQQSPPPRDDAQQMLNRHDRKLKVMSTHHEHLAQEIANLVISLGIGDKRMTDIETELKSNTEITTEIRDLMVAARVGFRVLGHIGTFAKWLGMLATAGAALYTAFYMLTHGGQPPGK